MRVLNATITFAALAALAAGCGQASEPQTVFSAQVDKASFHGTWPVVPTVGVLACDTSKGAGAVTFTPQGSATTYAINGPALDWGKRLGWPDSKEIWDGENWGDFIDTGLKMCDKKSGTPPPPMPSAAPFTEADLRGLYSPISFWDNMFKAASIADCAAQGADVTPSSPLAITHAWTLPGGVLACASDPDSGTGGRVGIVDLYFADPGADLHTALDSALAVLPADATHVNTLQGKNSAESGHPAGGCQIENYRSNILAAARNMHDPKGASMQDPHDVSVQMSTGHPLAGGYNDLPFNPASVHNATVIYGPTPAGPDGTASC